MPVEILKAVSVHEAVVLWLVVGRAARRHGLGHHLIDLGPAVGGETDQAFAKLAGVDASKVNWATIDAPSHFPMLFSKKVDATARPAFQDYVGQIRSKIGKVETATPNP